MCPVCYRNSWSNQRLGKSSSTYWFLSKIFRHQNKLGEGGKAQSRFQVGRRASGNTDKLNRTRSTRLKAILYFTVQNQKRKTVGNKTRNVDSVKTIGHQNKQTYPL